jgi:DNA replication protein DnaC
LISSGPTVRVKLSQHYSRQGLKGKVRWADELHRSTNPQQIRVREALLCHDPPRRVDVLALKGKSKLDLTAKFNSTQQKTYKALSNALEIVLVHGPFGTGKTELCLATATEVMSNPDVKNQVAYFVDSNRAVDDVASRWLEMCEDNKLNKTILRNISLYRIYRSIEAYAVQLSKVL